MPIDLDYDAVPHDPRAAELLRCTRQRIDDLLSQRRLTRIKEGRRTLIARADLDRYLAERSRR